MSGSPLPPSTGAPAGARRWASILLWACTLALSPVGGPARAAADIAERVVAVGDFQALREALVDSIEEEGLVVSAIIPFNDMLQRTALAAGPAAVSPFLRAEIVQFCSSRIAWQLLAEDRAQIALCPLSVSLQQRRDAPGVASHRGFDRWPSRRRCVAGTPGGAGRGPRPLAWRPPRPEIR
jgi:uncharacterized protein (DUF302 family)